MEQYYYFIRKPPPLYKKKIVPTNLRKGKFIAYILILCASKHAFNISQLIL